MVFIFSNRHQERVEAVIEIIKAVTGRDSVPDALIARINNMDFEELGRLVMNIAATRNVDDDDSMKTRRSQEGGE